MEEIERLRTENKRLMDLLTPEPKMTSYVYVLQSVGDYGTNNYKIGQTVNVERRKRTFNTSHRQQMIEVFTCPSHNAVILERVVHDSLWRFNVGGEHFCCPLNHIKTIITTAQSVLNQLKCSPVGIDSFGILEKAKNSYEDRKIKPIYPSASGIKSPYFDS
jgi:hypothetical protein